MSDNASTGQVTQSAADVYEAFFVPALFQEAAARTLEGCGLRPGMAALDVACGTGVLARALAGKVASAGTVTGIDLNEGMLAVAREKAPGITWRNGRAEALPFANASFDAAFCQFGLMFFEDRRAALAEMARVAKPGGTLAASVWGALDQTPGYAALSALVERLFGKACGEAIRAPFSLGDGDALRMLCMDAGWPAPAVRTLDVTARFPSLEQWLFTEIKGWTLADMIDDAQFDALLAASRSELAQFVGADGRVAFPAPALLCTAKAA
jgi:SAM-dependent methyltransferase